MDLLSSWQTWNAAAHDRYGLTLKKLMKASEIAIEINGELIGDPDLEVTAIASIDDVKENGLAFTMGKSGPESFSRIPRKSLLLIPADSALSPACSFIKVGNPKLAFARLARQLVPGLIREGKHATATIGEGAEVFAAFIGANVSIGMNARIGKGTRIFENVSIGDGVSVGENSTLYPNVVIYGGCEIGGECVFHSGAVIGAEGFGYVRDEGDIVQFPQIGNVVIEDGVEIGANTCVDRGALGETRIGRNTKIDNLVQIAHNVSIGRRVLIAAQVGISGSVVIEDDVLIGGQVGIGDHATIKSGAVLGGGTGVFSGKIVRAGFWAGNPAQPIKKYKEQIALMRSFARLNKDTKEKRRD